MTPLLVGMGLDELSMSASSIPFVRMMISKINKKDAEALVDLAINVDTEKEVKALINDFLDKNNIKII
jgi:phosphotransferase system enzyme I (PtsI)